MSGLCGWIGHGAGMSENCLLVKRMAEPLARYDATDIRFLAGARSALAVASAPGASDIYEGDGLRVAIFGQAKFRDRELALKAQATSAAQALAKGWLEKGTGICTDVSGTFSFCILDEDSDKAILAVDRMGAHPLAYACAEGSLIFGSSAHALLCHPRANDQFDPQAIYNYIYFHMIPGPGSMYKAQQRLLPGEFLFYSGGRANIHQYWKMEFCEQKTLPFDELKREFLRLLHSSVREAADDSKVGAFLSGGTDSSTIAGILSAVTGQPARTYSIGFEAEGYDEMEYARIAARHFSTSHHEYYVTPDDVVDAIPRIAAIFDQPFGNASAVPAYYCARIAKEDGVGKILGGDGGDELFGGNERYAKQYIFSLYEHCPHAIRKGLLEPFAFTFPEDSSIRLLRKARSYIKQASVPMPARLETYNLLEYYGRTRIFTPEFLAEVDANIPLSSLNESYARTNAKSLINRMLALDLKVTLADNDLPKVRKACELARMEVAFPFLNDEMVAFSGSLAPRLKLKGTRLRYFFKEALRGMLPDEIITKKKHGFGLPFGIWLQNHRPLQAMAADSLTNLKSRDIVRAEFIDQLLGHHLKEHASYHGTMVWILMMLEQWFQQRQGAEPVSDYELNRPGYRGGFNA